MAQCHNRNIIILFISLCFLNDTIANESGAVLNVVTRILPSCSIDANPLTFSSTKKSSSTHIGVTCTAGIPYVVSIDAGDNSTDINQRKLQFDNHYVKYQLYQDTSKKKIWGNSSDNKLSNIGTGITQRYELNGLIQKNDNTEPGIYQDTVRVSIDMPTLGQNTDDSITYLMQTAIKVSVTVQ